MNAGSFLTKSTAKFAASGALMCMPGMDMSMVMPMAMCRFALEEIRKVDKRLRSRD